MKPGRPTATLTLDGQSLTATEAGLLALSVRQSHGAHDAVDLSLWPRSKFASAAPGATLTVALGTDTDNEDVFTGEIIAVRRTPAALRLEALSATIALSRLRQSRTYLDQTIADIVNDLASFVGTDDVTADVKLSAYSIDDRRTVWAHILELATLAGAEAGVSASGTIRFVPAGTSPVTHTLRYGATLLSWDIQTIASPHVPKVFASGAASEQGAERWHWLARDPVGEGTEPARLIGSFHTRDAADALAKTLGDAAKRATTRGSIRLVGEPTLRPGDVVELKDLPGDASGSFRILTLRHIFNPHAGFVTEATVEGAGSPGGFGP